MGGAGKHGFVSCDVCKKKVTGNRFKCNVCPDFDMCDSCVNEGADSLHYDGSTGAPHLFVKIPDSRRVTFPIVFKRQTTAELVEMVKAEQAKDAAKEK